MCVGTLYVCMPMHRIHVLLMEARRGSGPREWRERLLRAALSVKTQIQVLSRSGQYS